MVPYSQVALLFWNTHDDGEEIFFTKPRGTSQIHGVKDGWYTRKGSIGQ